MAKRKPFDISFDETFDSFMQEFERYMTEFDEHMSEFEDDDSESSEPYYYGFSITQRNGEPPEIKEFGSRPVSSERIEIGESDADSRKTLVDVFEISDEVHVVADLPSTKQDEIELYPSEKALEIRTINAANLSEKVELPVKVDTKSVKQSYKNGVLEVTFKLKEK